MHPTLKTGLDWIAEHVAPALRIGAGLLAAFLAGQAVMATRQQGASTGEALLLLLLPSTPAAAAALLTGLMLPALVYLAAGMIELASGRAPSRRQLALHLATQHRLLSEGGLDTRGVVHARAFVLHDDEGRVRGTMRVTDGNPRSRSATQRAPCAPRYASTTTIRCSVSGRPVAPAPCADGRSRARTLRDRHGREGWLRRSRRQQRQRDDPCTARGQRKSTQRHRNVGRQCLGTSARRRGEGLRRGVRRRQRRDPHPSRAPRQYRRRRREHGQRRPCGGVLVGSSACCADRRRVPVPRTQRGPRDRARARLRRVPGRNEP